MQDFETYQEIFDRRGDAYHRAMRQCPDAREDEFQEVVRRAAPRPHEVLADMPSGGGYLLRHLQAPRPEVHLVETVSSFRDACPTGEGIQSHLASLETLPFAEASVDVVVSVAGCHHLPAKDVVWREVARVLVPGGRFILADVREGTPPGEFLNGFVDRHNSQGHDGRFLDDGTPGELEGAGLEVRVSESVRYPWRFADRSEMAVFAMLLFGLDRATPEDVVQGMEEILGVADTARGVAVGWGLDFHEAHRPRG